MSDKKKLPVRRKGEARITAGAPDYMTADTEKMLIDMAMGMGVGSLSRSGDKLNPAIKYLADMMKKYGKGPMETLNNIAERAGLGGNGYGIQQGGHPRTASQAIKKIHGTDMRNAEPSPVFDEIESAMSSHALGVEAPGPLGDIVPGSGAASKRMPQGAKPPELPDSVNDRAMDPGYMRRMKQVIAGEPDKHLVAEGLGEATLQSLKGLTRDEAVLRGLQQMADTWLKRRRP